MDWENERYVRLYIRDTAAWRMWPWEARAVLPLLMRKLDRSGRTPLDRHGVEGIAVLIELPVEVTRAGLKALVEDGCIVTEPGALCMPNFTAGQTARQSAAVRKAEQRERDQMEKDAKPRKACATLPPSIAGLLDNEEKSRDVTRCDSRHSSLAEPSLAELNLDPPLPPAVAGGVREGKPKRSKVENPPGLSVLTAEIEQHVGICYPPSAFEGLRERLKEHSLDDLLAYVRWAARDDWLRTTVLLKPSVLLRKARCAEGVAAAKAGTTPAPAPKNNQPDAPAWLVEKYRDFA